ncbi:carboxypeptidase regulatory-like domain-containing protein [Castellaniella sp.]|uniref:carboxypeptidase regulatory-like domain-containing protein n=1 Tax=Castellaniella sp. TaxID=1955812 RepID=UPI002AFF6AC6|nr:carboxypeptidase regulatory-like domain-containing protein [Castellaniella sp.]
MQLSSVTHMNHHLTRTAALAGLALAGAGFLAPAWATLPAPQHQGNIEYLSGGIGIDESTSFKDAMGKFPLSMTFDQMEQGKGDYVADVQVAITDAHGTPVLDTTAQGPYLLAKLPDGRYQVKATYQHRTQTRDVTIGGKTPEHLVFSWRSDMAKQ